MLLDFILWGCSLLFSFPSVYLRFTPNPGLYTSISLCSLHNCSLPFSDILRSSTILSGGFVPLCVIPSIHQGGLSQKWKCGWNLIGECLCVRTMQSWNEVITVPNSTMSLMHTIVPGSTMDLGIELCVVPCNTTLQPQLQSGH